MRLSDALKKVLKQGGHSNIGWIVSGQSVMTSQIKGFKDDDRSLFTEIIIGIPKIRMYVKKYARGKNSDANLAKLERNLDDLEAYIESVNDRITDDARLLRIALIVDEKSPKLYFLPNLDNVNFDEVSISESEKKASGILLDSQSQSAQAQAGSKRQNVATAALSTIEPNEPKPTMQGVVHCPHCGNSEMSFLAEQRYKCKPCGKKISPSKVVFK
jgi:DNA-directed RNA polymerase subunit M/transcription elongation factor TFIIS